MIVQNSRRSMRQSIRTRKRRSTPRYARFR
jgi:hypothetical protein